MQEIKEAEAEKAQFFRVCSLIDRPKVQRFILGVIFFNALILGLETSPHLMAQAGGLLTTLDGICLGIFTIEILLKLMVWRISFFRSGWNIFDFLVVAISFVPGSGPLTILRALRILRVLRLVSNLPRLRVIVEAVFRSLPSIGWISGLLLIIFYIFSVLVTSLFGKEFPEWFGSIGASMYTLFQVLTLESWSMGIVRPVMELFPHAYLVFISFVMVTSFIVLNVFIGIIVGTMSEVAAENKIVETTPPGAGPAQEEDLARELALFKEQLIRVQALVNLFDQKRPEGGHDI
jgi:voltage-gated sodium channel